MTTVTLGAGESLAYGPMLFTADKMGYFEAENIEVEFQTLTDPSDMLTLINSGDIDAGFGGISAGFFNAIDRGLDIAAVVSHSSYPEGREKGAGIYIRADLAESGEVTEVADLEGLTFGLHGGTGDIGNAGGFYLGKVLGSAGLTLSDVEITNVSIADTDELAWNPQTLEDMQQLFLDYGGVLGYDEIMPFSEFTNEPMRMAAAESIAICEY